MNRLSVRLTTIIDVVSLLTLGSEFVFFYTCTNRILFFAILCLTLFVCTSIFIRTSHTFDAVFLYSFILVLFSSFVIGFLFIKGNAFSIKYQEELFYLVLLNWLIPMLCSVIHNLHDSREQYAHFTSFFNKSSIQFIIYYAGFLALLIVAKPVTLPCISSTMEQSIKEASHGNMIPFYRIACYIEDSIYNHTDLKPLFQYILASALVTLPYGFYIALLFKRKGHLIRLLLLFPLPIVIELCKHFIAQEATDVEHIFLGVLGGLLGSCIFFLLNNRYNHLRHYDFLEGRRYYNW
ncbi:VanZ family protein [Anaerosporobacter faecicola]|uniref:VanZ family protein n=1 Tax=Anaerosporobacter faecicola TaxID=2718714 RepID=UPI001439417E|nr:VanZ family protein [Anaerosporobacter faecicola]